MTTKKDTTLLVLREIRDEMRSTHDEIRTLREELTQRIDGTNERLGQLEIGFLDIAQQQRFVVRYLRAMSERDHRFEADLTVLRARVEAIETRLDR